jgi:DNA repair protein RecN (Recombination protein N)
LLLKITDALLVKLFIKNYILIDELTLVFNKNLNIITGETGAGKSILLGALGLILGNRAESNTLNNPELKGIIEGVFDIQNKDVKSFFIEHELDYLPNTIIRREITPSGVSRSFINDTPVTLQVLKQLSEQLVDLHSQHETTQLFTNQFQLKLVDAYAKQLEAITQYQTNYQQWQGVKKDLENCIIKQREALRDKDYIMFQYQELHDAKLLDANEQTETENALKLATNQETIQLKLNTAIHRLNEPNALLDTLSELENTIKSLVNLLPNFEQYRQRCDAAYIDMKELCNELQYEANNTQSNEEDLAQLQERSATLYRLQKKHKTADIAGLQQLRDTLELQLQQAEQFDDEIATLEKKEKEIVKMLQLAANEISKKREAAIEPMQKYIHQNLNELMMANAICKIELTPTELNPNGCNAIQFMFSANKGQEMSELKKVASGGELARLMLTLKSMVAEQLDLPTMIFDEIDTGISGEVAMRVGIAMEQLAAKKQIITITHLPQIAARKGTHFFVYKNDNNLKTQTFIKQLTEQERINEIAKMMSGDALTDKSILAATELLNV